MPRGNKTAPSRIEAVEKQSEALKLRKAGWTYAAIADKLGYAAAGGAEKAVKAALHKMLKDDAKDVLELELARLDDMLHGLYHMAEIGNPMAVDRVLRIMERRANYLGIDAPKKVTFEGDLTADFVNKIARQLMELGVESPAKAFEELLNAVAAEHQTSSTDGSE